MTSIIFKSGGFDSLGDSGDKLGELINKFVTIIPEGIDIDLDNLGKSISPAFLFGEILSGMNGKGALDVAMTLVVLTFIVFLSTLYETKFTHIMEAGVSISIIVTVLDSFYELTKEVCTSLDQLASFFASLAPVLVSVAVFGGENNLALSSSMQMTLTASVLEMLVGKMILPLISAMLVLGVASMLGGSVVPRIQKTIKNIFTKALGLASVVCGILFTLQSILASASDSAALRLAKFTAQSVAPAVGSVISSSMSTIVSGVGYVKSVVGAGAIYVIVFLVLSPLPRLLLYRTVLSICHNFAETMETKILARGLSGLYSALDALISVYLIFGALFALHIILFVKSGASVI